MDDIDNKIKEALNQKIVLPQDYENAINDTLKNVNMKNINVINKISKVAAVIVMLFVGAGVYAYYSSEIMNKEKYQPEQTISEAIPYYHEDYDMEYIDNLSGYTNATEYEIIATYDKYLENISKYANMIEMTEDDFDRYIVLIILPNKHSEISNIYTNKETMYIELKHIEDNIKIPERWIIAKVEKNLYKENIIIKRIPELDSFTGYTPIFDLPEDYSKENAINDGCIVTEQISNTNDFNLISNNQYKIDEFIEKCENGEEGSIRIINYAEDVIYYINIYHSTGIYNVCRYEDNLLDEHESRTDFYSANQIIIFKGEHPDLPSYGNREYHLYDVKYGANNWITELLRFKH